MGLGTGLQREQNDLLKQKVAQFKTSVFLGVEHGQSIRFPDFLRLMGWMLKTNFGNIKQVADNAAKEIAAAKEAAAAAAKEAAREAREVAAASKEAAAAGSRKGSKNRTGSKEVRMGSKEIIQQ